MFSSETNWHVQWGEHSNYRRHNRNNR